MSELTRLKRHKTIPFLNITTTEAEEWARIGKSTVFDLVLNAETEENDFIDSEMKTTDITSYKPELSQELQSNKGDAAFDYLYDMFFNLPTGEDVKKDLLIVFDGNKGTDAGGCLRHLRQPVPVYGEAVCGYFHQQHFYLCRLAE